MKNGLGEDKGQCALEKMWTPHTASHKYIDALRQYPSQVMKHVA